MSCKIADTRHYGTSCLGQKPNDKIYFSILGPIKPAEIKMEKFCTNYQELELEEEEFLEVPREITELFTCPMCFKKYASASDLENHIAIFHKIPRKIQRQSLLTSNNPLFVIKKEVVIEKDE